MFFIALFLIGCFWELYKLVGPQNGGSILGMPILPKANNQAMPHTWDIIGRLFEPETGGNSPPLWLRVAEYGWYSLRLSFGGLVLGTLTGVGLAVLMARFGLAERAILPWIIMSQTVPLIALAPQVLSWTGKVHVFGWEWPRWASVCLLAAFLSFFPVAVGTLRGLRSAPSAATELMESYAASWWSTLRRLRFPSAIPAMLPALRLAATLSVVGVVVAEVSTGSQGGIGRAVMSYLGKGTSDPTMVYAAVFGAGAVGMTLYGLVVLFDVYVMRNRPPEQTV